MKAIYFLTAALLLTPATALAQETKVRTGSGPNGSATQTTTIDKEAGTVDRNTVVTRASDGATATRDVNRIKTDTGSTVTVDATNFQGETRSAERVRTRTENGSTMTGTGTTFDGRSYGVSGERARTDNGYTASQRVTGSDGSTVASRDVVATRENGRVNRQVTTDRPQRERPQRSSRRARGGQ